MRKGPADRAVTARQHYLYGGLFLVLAVVLFVMVRHAEDTGGTVQLPVILIDVYDHFGIIGVAAVPGVLGLALIALGVREDRLRPRGSLTVDRDRATGRRRQPEEGPIDEAETR